jgi:hypothetical protein
MQTSTINYRCAVRSEKVPSQICGKHPKALQKQRQKAKAMMSRFGMEQINRALRIDLWTRGNDG